MPKRRKTIKSDDEVDDGDEFAIDEDLDVVEEGE